MHDSAYSLFLFLLFTVLVWIVVIGIFAFDFNQGAHNHWGGGGSGHSSGHGGGGGKGHGHGGHNNDGSGWVLSGIISWFILIGALFVDAFITNVISVHRAHISHGETAKQMRNRKKAETNCATLMFILIFITSIWIVVLYSVLLANCGQFGMCCDKPSGGEKCHDVSSGFWWQFALAIAGTIFAIVAAGCVIKEPSKGLAREREMKASAEYEDDADEEEMNNW